MESEVVRLASSDGVEVALHHLGGRGPVVILCHATGFHARIWDPIVESLMADFDCWAIDFRGHGDSTLPPGTPLVWTGMANDLLVAVDHIEESTGEAPITAVGHSMGGASIVMAELARPGTFTKAYLFEPILYPAIAENMKKRKNLSAGARRRTETFESLESAESRYAARPPLGNFDPRALHAYVEHGFRATSNGVMLKCRGETEAAVFENSDNRAYDRLHLVHTDILISAGGEPLGPASIAAQAAHLLANGSVHFDETLNHFGPMEQPDLFATRIAAHLRPGEQLEPTSKDST